MLIIKRRVGEVIYITHGEDTLEMMVSRLSNSFVEISITDSGDKKRFVIKRSKDAKDSDKTKGY